MVTSRLSLAATSKGRLRNHWFIPGAGLEGLKRRGNYGSLETVKNRYPSTSLRAGFLAKYARNGAPDWLLGAVEPTRRESNFCYNRRDMSLQPPFTDVPDALEEIRAGRMIVVVDDEDRENEGDLTLAAEKVTPEAINFMAKYGRGLVCLAMTEERLDHLRIGPMTAENTSQYGTAFCEAIDARQGVTTGISAYDRARTIQVAIDPATKPSDLARPGHVFPLEARKGGVLVRAGQTEAAVDLARMAGLIPAGVICEIMRDDGTMARVPDLIEFCKTHSMKML